MKTAFKKHQDCNITRTAIKSLITFYHKTNLYIHLIIQRRFFTQAIIFFSLQSQENYQSICYLQFQNDNHLFWSLVCVMEVDKPFAVQFVHDMHFRHHLFSGLLGYLQELCSVFRPRAFLFNFLHNAKFTPEEDNKSCLPVYP